MKGKNVQYIGFVALGGITLTLSYLLMKEWKNISLGKQVRKTVSHFLIAHGATENHGVFSNGPVKVSMPVNAAINSTVAASLYCLESNPAEIEDTSAKAPPPIKTFAEDITGSGNNVSAKEKITPSTDFQNPIGLQGPSTQFSTSPIFDNATQEGASSSTPNSQTTFSYELGGPGASQKKPSEQDVFGDYVQSGSDKRQI